MTPFTAGLLEAKRQSRAGRAARSRSPSTGPARNSPSVRSTSRRSPSPTRSPSRCRWRSPRRPAPSSTPATGRSIRTPAIGPLTDEAALPRARRRRRAGADLRFHQCAARRRIAVGEGGRREPARSSSRRRKGRVAITTFSSNVGRISSVAEAARDAGREVLVLGRSMKRMIERRRRARLHGGRAGVPRRGGVSASSRATSWSSCAPAARARRAPHSPSWRATR